MSAASAAARASLYPERQAVDARRAESLELLALERARIRLQGNLGVGRQRHPCANFCQHPVDRRGRKKARRAAADEYRDDPASPDRGQCGLEIGDEGVDVGGLREIAFRLVRIEVAIRAFADAPRNVHVKRERRQRREPRP